MKKDKKLECFWDKKVYFCQCGNHNSNGILRTPIKKIEIVKGLKFEVVKTNQYEVLPLPLSHCEIVFLEWHSGYVNVYYLLFTGESRSQLTVQTLAKTTYKELQEMIENGNIKLISLPE